MIAIVDYGVGNLYSLCSSVRYIGAECVLTSDPDAIAQADSVILPGVGAFGDAAEKLRTSGLGQAVRQAAGNGKPLLGICLGMQLLFDSSEEYGLHKGLGLIFGHVKSLADDLGAPLKIPHIGWNELGFFKPSPLLADIRENDCVYYVHSFYVPKGGFTAAGSQYGNAGISGVVQRENVFGTQFHPEKSGKVGLAILSAFAQLR